MKDRLRQIINYTGLKQSEFADKLDVQRSNISHFLSGRNKPRVDFIEKLKEVFPEVNLDWLIIGLGEMLVSQNVTQETDSTPPKEETIQKEPKNKQVTDDTTVTTETQQNKPEVQTTQIISSTEEGSPNEIIIIYSDKTFDTYKKRK